MAVGSKFAGFPVAATCDFQPNPGCLAFNAGDQLEILRWSKFGWWWASCTSTGKQGWIPSAYVQPVAPLAPAPAAATTQSPGLQQAPSPNVVSQLPQPQDMVDALLKPTSTEVSQQQDMFDTVPKPASTEVSQPRDIADAVLTPPSTEVWPPLPPGPPPLSCDSLDAQEHKPPLPPTPALIPTGTNTGVDAASLKTSAELVEEEYDQSLGFLPDGRVSTRGSYEVHGVRQLHHFFNLERWTEHRNCQERMRCKRPSPVRLTGDGGFKRRR